MKPLAIIPTYVTKGTDVTVAADAVTSLRKTVGDACDLYVIDDGSPEQDLVTALRAVVEEHDGEFMAKPRNEGFAKTVNVGLRRAMNEERDSVLVNADIEFVTEGWLNLMQQQASSDGSRPAGIVGARLLYPNGLIQHAGIFFSILSREFDHIYRYGPGDLPEALHAREVPVTGALQYIRYACLEEVGLYDENFKLGWEDVDYCIRAWLAGQPIVYQPGVVAYHHESFFRAGRKSAKIEKWTQQSWMHFCDKWRDQSFAEFVPSLV